MKTYSVIVACVLALLSAEAPAQPFLGASLGQSDVDDSVASGLITSGSIDGKGTGFKVFGGAFFSPYFGAELAYVDLGKATYGGMFESLVVADGRVETWGYNVAGIARYPVGERFTVFGKLGVFLWESEAGDTTDGTPFSNKERGWNGSFGFGATWAITPKISARAEWERFSIESADASLLSIGVQYNF